jgi:antitoxin (DNA-binding transcriptional repressor) of toxin-antitoxin stability system
MYMQYIGPMKVRKVNTKGVEEARRAFPALLDAAARGVTTIITRRGIAVAAIVPAGTATQVRPISLMSLAGSGKGLWGPDSAKTIARMRDEWTR